jgi:hypothetical protein
MTKAEALVLLELSPDAPAATVKATIEEQMDLLEELSEKASSDFLRRLHTRKLSTIKNILQEYRQWQYDEPAKQPVQAAMAKPAPPAVAGKKNEEEIGATINAAPAGWLIRHTENMFAANFAIHAGLNFIGRKQHPSLRPFIVMEDDAFISRLQCVVYAEDSNSLFYISDPSAFNNGKTSSNGTFLNGSNQPITARQPLEDGDTIQVGVTKFVFRIAHAAIDQLAAAVAQNPYTQTVVLA